MLMISGLRKIPCCIFSKLAVIQINFPCTPLVILSRLTQFLKMSKFIESAPQEIINIYPAINPPVLSAHQSNRVCNALALLQCVASHAETR